MPRKRKYPERVYIPIPADIVEIYETHLLNIVFPEKTAEMASKIIGHITAYGSLSRDDWKELCSNEAEHKLFNRTINKMIALGMLKRSKWGEFILSEEFGTKLGILIQKWEAIRKPLKEQLLGI